MLDLKYLLQKAVEKGASDLHITINNPPRMRIDGELCNAGTQLLDASQTQELCMQILSPEQKKQLQEGKKELDFAFEIEGVSRFRCNIFHNLKSICGVFRVIPYKILSFEELGLPRIGFSMIDARPGLVLITGATGSGKSTTLAAMVDKINSDRNHHVLTIEDPVEFVHPKKKAIVTQREVGVDTDSFASALKYALREDPDVVLVGEMRDLETISNALTIAETGHLVLATLHTNSAVQSINRIIDVFPSHQQPQVRTQLSFVLKGVFSQKLVPAANGSGRVLALETLCPNNAIRQLIREDKLHQIESHMLSGQRSHGMQVMDMHLVSLVKEGKIRRETAIQHAKNPEDMQSELPQTGLGF
ncbi:type IV pilus twitching motility protein PilT [Geoalkalibacter subterraneus]|uniref:Twitching motility protein pilT n=1 Tax=Geoalkalibacter subterraneus TaxID=483547 RepID=A0A0B5FLJ0_9BACT|nr:twitching motility protein pilT [Geoalkalibacter subterraneus]